MIIGKIPGYNSKTRGNAGVDYENRLLSNLTIVNFSPIGYSINLSIAALHDTSRVCYKPPYS